MFSLSPKQLSFEKELSEMALLPNNNPRKFIDLLSNHFDLSTFIPKSFYDKYYDSNTNVREYSLESIIASLLCIHFFNFSKVSDFIILLTFSSEIRDVCGFDTNKIPNESVFSKFKNKFDKELLSLFDSISIEVINIFNEYNETLADKHPSKNLNATLFYDTTGLKPKVKENNPKVIYGEIQKQSKVKKLTNNDKLDVYKAAYAKMPKASDANKAIKLDYANGHFGYFYKLGMITNGFGIPLHIHFFENDFYKELPNEFLSMENQKHIFDNASLKPVLSNFATKINIESFKTFMADSEFDSYANYSLLNHFNFKKVLIPINRRNSKKSKNLKFNLNSEFVPLCPNNEHLEFISDGTVKGIKRSFRLKFVCPMSVKSKGKWTCNCKDKCRETKSTITHYVYPNGELRAFFGVVRGSDEWVNSYKKRTAIERQFSALKSHPNLESPKTLNCASMRSDFTLSAITKLITVILAHSIKKPEYMSNLRNLINNCA